MNFKFNFRNEKNQFTKGDSWDKIKKVTFISSDLTQETINNINKWLNSDSKFISKKFSFLCDGIFMININKNDGKFIDNFFNDYVNGKIVNTNKIGMKKFYSMFVNFSYNKF